MTNLRNSLTSVCLVLLASACGSGTGATSPARGGGSSGDPNGGSAGSANGGSVGSGGISGGGSGGSAGGASGDSSGGVSGGGGNVQSGGSVSRSSGGAAGAANGGAAGSGGAAGGGGGAGGGGAGAGGTASGGSEAGRSGSGGASGTGGTTVSSNTLVTSASGSYWKTGTFTEVTSNASVTVNDTSTAQTWEGFGGAFNELGWSVLTSKAMQDQAIKLLFGDDGCRFAWGRIPMGSSDYGTSRYTCDDTGSDVTPDGSESNRPPADTALDKFSLARDEKNLIPYIKAAQAVKPDIHFWASPWTPPVWMKTGYKKDIMGSSGNAKKPSYFDGGSMKNDAATLSAYAQYYAKFVQGYKDQGIDIELVSPQNEPGYELNYPSCLWDKSTYIAWIGQYLGPAMKNIGVKVMLGTLSNSDSGKDIDTAQAAAADATAKTFLSVVGVQWGVLDKVNSGTTFGNLPIWASEHKAGNYPWNPDGSPKYNGTQAPNDQAYGVESWNYIRDAITKGKVTAYSAWNMVLDKLGLGIDTSRDWKQDALLVADGGNVTPTPAYYVFRHFSQFVEPGAKVVKTSGGDAVAFKNPDGSLVAVMYNSGSAGTTTVAIGGKKLQFAMPGGGWATVKYKP
jgi:glucosylceramidase